MGKLLCGLPDLTIYDKLVYQFMDISQIGDVILMRDDGDDDGLDGVIDNRRL